MKLAQKNYFSKKSSRRQSLQQELSLNIQILGKLKRSVSGFAEDTAGNERSVYRWKCLSTDV